MTDKSLVELAREYLPRNPCCGDGQVLISELADRIEELKTERNALGKQVFELNIVLAAYRNTHAKLEKVREAAKAYLLHKYADSFDALNEALAACEEKDKPTQRDAHGTIVEQCDGDENFANRLITSPCKSMFSEEKDDG